MNAGKAAMAMSATVRLVPIRFTAVIATVAPMNMPMTTTIPKHRADFGYSKAGVHQKRAHHREIHALGDAARSQQADDDVGGPCGGESAPTEGLTPPC